ncbi:MAG: glucoamylase family protein [Candidatus Binatia bacterium]
MALLVTISANLLKSPPPALPSLGGSVIDPGCDTDRIVSLDSWMLARLERPPVLTPKKRSWEHALGPGRQAQTALRARLAGWPAHLLTDARALPRGPRAFAERLARDTWRGLADLTDRANGLPLDTIAFSAGLRGGAPTAARIADYTNVTNIGLHLAATVGALELGLLDRTEALRRIERVLATLGELETDAGFFFNYYDTTSLERTSHFLSFVDSSWLTAGLMLVRMTFPELYEHCSALIAQSNFGVMYDAVAGLMSHGYYVDPRARSRYHYGVLYTEARLGTLLAIGKGDVPEAAWFNMVRTFPAECRWQSRAPVDVRTVEVRGHLVTAGHYRWGSLRYVPSWGGSMFEALMPTLLIDELEAAPRSLGRNGLMHALGQRRFAMRELRLPVWGFSPSARPDGEQYGEYGVKALGSRGYPSGPVTPHAAALAVPLIPKAAIRNLQKLAARYPVYGEYGLYDAVDPYTGAVAYKYLALDQSMLFLSLVNHLTDHALQRRFAADPIMQRALPLIGDEDFFH